MAGGMLTPEQLELFNTQGYLVLEGFASAEEVAQLKQRGAELVAAFDPADHPASVFSTRSQVETTDTYFLDSASAVHYFLEERAFDEQGRLTKPKELACNKLGHALHDVDPVFRQFSRSPKVQQLARSLGYRRPLPVQSMFIFKQPGVGGEVVPHQDSTFLATDPPSCTGIWLALEDATVENSCLWTLPGAHKAGVHRRFLRTPDDAVKFEGELPAFDMQQFVPVEVPAGSLVVLHGANVHMSKANTSPHSRHAYTMHIVEGAQGCTWQASNWLQRREGLPFKELYDDAAAQQAAGA